MGRGARGRLVQGPKCQRQNGAEISEHLGRGTRIGPAFRGKKTPNRGKAVTAVGSSSAIDALLSCPFHIYLLLILNSR